MQKALNVELAGIQIVANEIVVVEETVVVAAVVMVVVVVVMVAEAAAVVVAAVVAEVAEVMETLLQMWLPVNNVLGISMCNYYLFI